MADRAFYFLWNRLGCKCLNWYSFFFFSSKTHQPGREMLLSFKHQQSSAKLHPRAQVHPYSKLPLPSDVSIVFVLALVSDTHTSTLNRVFSILALKHQTVFLLIGNFSPSISKMWQGREKSCACMCTHTPLCHSLSHTHAQRVVFTTGRLMHPQEVR